MSQNPDSQRYFLYGKAFHRLNKLPRSEKTYSIAFQGFVANLTREQTILLSTNAYQWNHQFKKSFEIGKPPGNISNAKVSEAFRSLLSLFIDVEQIEINYLNKPAFLFLAHQFDNRSLENVCFKVNLNISQHFFFTSERFIQIHQQTLSQLFDFTVYINNEPFFCNYAFASCLSNTIFDLHCQNPTIQDIHFDGIYFDDILLSLFQILNGYSFDYLPSYINQIQSAIDLIGLPSFSGKLPSPTTFEEAIQFLSNIVFINFKNNLKVHVI
jgi:hypothetical protein